MAALSGLSDRLLYMLVTGLGSGLSPIAPGTCGSLLAVLIGLLLQVFWQGTTLAAVLGGLALVLLIAGCGTTAFVDRAFPNKDPGAFVLDEVVGYFVALAVIAGLQKNGPTATAHAACFVLFRIFDVLKPPPVNRAEEFPGAIGIMADDVVAGIYAGLALWALHSFDLLP